MEKLASNLYLSVHSLPQEEPHDTDDASAGEVYPILVSESTVCTIQPLMWLYSSGHTETRKPRSRRGVFDESTHDEKISG